MTLVTLVATQNTTNAMQYTVTKNPFSDYAASNSYTPPIVVGEVNPFTQDVSKNASFIPPVFGSYTADTLNSGELLTPNLVGTPPAYTSPSTGVVGTGGSSSGNVSGGSGTATDPDSWDSYYPPTSVTPPDVSTDSSENSNSFSSGSSGNSGSLPSYTTTDGMIDGDNKLGHLKVEAAGIDFPVYEGTEESSILYGAGHFDFMSAWNGNVGMAGHNRGVNNNFGEIHNLNQGDIMEYTTIYGTRTYAVVSVTKIYCTDFSLLSMTTDNRLTLITCVEDERDYRWAVQAVEVTT